MQRQLNGTRQPLHPGNSRAPALRQESSLQRRCFPDQGSRPARALLGALGDTWPVQMVVPKTSVHTAQRLPPWVSGAAPRPRCLLCAAAAPLQPRNKVLCAGEKNLIWLKEQTETRLIYVIAVN